MDSISASFIHLDLVGVLLLLIFGFVGGLVSGFIGSGGAFVLTPAMMSIGVPGIVAVASNICHKFPKALVGALKRAKYGQVDYKLGIVLGVSAEAGMLYGASIQESIKTSFGHAGSNLYVSSAFVAVLAIVGSFVLLDAWKAYRAGTTQAAEKLNALSRWVQSLNIPGTMIYFPSIKTRISFLVTIPIGFATGMLAATIAVGGFIGVPAMMYVLGVPSLMASASELVIAFVMGVGGTIKYGWGGHVDIRLAMIILAGSLFGIQLGAIGTTYVKPYMVKVVMGTIMMIVLVSRAIVIPVYLSDLNLIERIAPESVKHLQNLSFGIMSLALLVGAGIILRALIVGMHTHHKELAVAEATAALVARRKPLRLSPVGRFDHVLVASDGSEFSVAAIRLGARFAMSNKAELTTMSMMMIDLEAEGNAADVLKCAEIEARKALGEAQILASAEGYDTRIELREGINPSKEIVRLADDLHADLIIMGRRGRRGLARLMVGDATRKVIGYADCNVLIVPRAAKMWQQRILLATDGSRHSEKAAETAGQLAKMFGLPMSVLSVLRPKFDEVRRAEAQLEVDRVREVVANEGIKVDSSIIENPDTAAAILDFSRSCGADLIVMGSHGRTGLGRLLLGSVAERVIGETICPVMVVKA